MVRAKPWTWFQKAQIGIPAFACAAGISLTLVGIKKAEHDMARNKAADEERERRKKTDTEETRSLKLRGDIPGEIPVLGEGDAISREQLHGLIAQEGERRKQEA
mmetsp:Transcript_19561/g.46437  ORF Transcript_19561/g.46437 Transcript_19561/m.46437 type:complete len:104 (+) Transcript_19561:111-422(+)